MPEGPSIIIMRDAVMHFRGKTIVDVWGSGKFTPELLLNKKLRAIRSLGKQLFLTVKGTTIRVHLLMFGSYSLNEQNRPDSRVRLAMTFPKGGVFFYTCSVTELEGDPDTTLDWESDIMGDLWNPVKARKKLKGIGEIVISDALLDQSVFAGVGNIIKNEVLYRVRLHPETLVKDIPARLISIMMKELRKYCFEFLEQKKAGVLKRNWQVYTKKICKRCDLPFNKKYIGRTKRRTFYCENCQVFYYS
ncbi:MAG: DNA-formamidopyrimidine glycosylase family protein [Chitinophagaceae bacterium]